MAEEENTDTQQLETKKPLDQCTPAEIAEISQGGEASTRFQVGNSIFINVDGKPQRFYIADFDHYIDNHGYVLGITFISANPILLNKPINNRPENALEDTELGELGYISSDLVTTELPKLFNQLDKEWQKVIKKSRIKCVDIHGVPASTCCSLFVPSVTELYGESYINSFSRKYMGASWVADEGTQLELYKSVFSPITTDGFTRSLCLEYPKYFWYSSYGHLDCVPATSTEDYYILFSV